MSNKGVRLHNRILATLLSVVLVTSGVPTGALAEAANVASVDSLATSQEAGAVTDDGQDSPSSAGAAGESGSGSTGTASGGTQENTATVASGDLAESRVVSTQNDSLATKVVPQVRSVASASAAATTFSSDDDVYIESSADATGGYSVSGSIPAGTTVYAHVYDYSEDERIDPSADWTYQWYVLSYQYGSASDDAAIAGATSESFTPTEDLAGKYLKVKVTCSSASVTSSGVGPVKKPLAAGAVTLYSVEFAGEKSVGSTVTATAYEGSYSSKTPVSEGVTYTWRYSDTKPSYSGTTWTTIEGATGSTLELTETLKGKYLSVVANAGDNDVTTGDSSYSAFGPVLGEGETELYNVKLVDAPDTVEVGTTLTAQAYVGTYSSQTPVTQNVTYTWRYRDSQYSGDWTAIEGQTGATLTVGESLVGKYLSVTASAGANTVELSSYSAVGPVKLAGAVDIYSAYVTTTQDASSGTAKYTAADTLWAQAKEKGASVTIESSKLAFQWQVSDDNSTWSDIEGATGQSLTLSSYEGKYVRCHVSAQVGDSSYDTRSRNKVAAADVVDVASVKLDKSGALQVGDVVAATATDQDGNDATSSAQVVWQWYASDTSTGAGEAIEGASGTLLTVTDDLLGKYVTAHANGSAGAWSDVTSSAAGPVKIAGAVTLHHVEASGKAVVGGTMTAQAYTSSYTKTDSSDTVLYQWQYAETKSTSDISFFDIPGATGASYTIPESFEDASGNTVSLLGKYLRVKATSDGSVVSTSQKSYYSSTSVDPLGPVSLKGGYDLTGVKVTSSKTNAQVGSTLSAVAQYLKQGSYSSYDTDVPDDAEVTYNWYQADDASGTNRALLKSETITGPTASTLALASEQQGKYVWVEAVAKMQPATSEKTTVVGEGSYGLHHVNLSPSNQTILTGSEVSASVYASQLGSTTNTEVTGRDGVSVQWYEADAADAADDQWTLVEGASDATLAVPATSAGKYLRAVATSGGASVSATFDAPVVDSTSLEGAKALLQQDYGWRPSLTYGTDTNINETLKAALEEKGFDTSGLTVKVESVEFTSTAADAQVGISTDDSDANGDITYFYIDPSNTNSWTISGLHTVKSITFELSREGEESVSFTPTRTFQIPWDEARLAELLQQRAEEIVLGYAEGDAAENVTGNLTLPYRAGANDSASWTSVVWSSTSDAVSVTGYGWSDYTGTVTRSSSDEQAKLTATVSGSSNYDMPSGVTASRDFDITVKADPEKVAAAQEELQQKLDSGFTYDNVADFVTGGTVDHDAVAGDLQMPRPSKLGVDGKYYSVTFTADDGAVTFNGYHATVVQPLESAQSVNVTCTVTSKENPEVTASKTLTFTVSPVSSDEIDAEVALLQKVQTAYKDALLGQGDSQQAEPVTGNLDTFQKAYLDASGNLVFARSAADAAGQEGIVPVELPGYDSMGSYDQARLFKSSNTDVVLNETLQLAWNADRSTTLSQYHEQPQYNTQVTVSSKLASERFGAYYETYKDDDSVDDATKAKLQQLAGTDVSADINVAGTTGREELRVTGSIIGQDDAGTARTWATLPSTTYAEGTTADVAVKQMLDSAGVSYEASGEGSSFYLSSITKDGVTLGWDATTGKFWQFYVNGAASSVGLGSYVLQPGDVITLAYSAWGDDIPTPVASVTVTGSVVGLDEDGYGQTWAADTTFEYDADKNATAKDVFETLLGANGLTYDASDTAYGWYLSTITKDGRTLGYDASTGKYWQFYVNGEAASVGAGSYVLQDGDTVTLAYSAWGESVPNTSWVKPTVQIVGQSEDGKVEEWAPSTSYTLEAGTTARVAVERLLNSTEGLSFEASGSGDGYYLSSVSKDGRALAWDETSGKFWQFYVNGVSQNVGMDSYVIQPGDSIVLAYSAWGDPVPSVEKVTTSVMVVGIDSDGKGEEWAPQTRYTLDEGSTAADAVKQLLDSTDDLTYEANDTAYGWYLSTITKNGKTLGYDASTGKYWQFFVNGQASDVGMSDYVLQSGDVITLAYSAYGEGIPAAREVNGVEVHPEKVRPTSIASDWPSFLGKDAANYSEAATATDGSDLSWSQQVLVKAPGMFTDYASDPILVGGKVIVAKSDELQMRNAATGAVEHTAKLVAKIDSSCRMVYADGVIVVPLHDGILQALTADDLTTVWITPSVDGAAGDDVSSSDQQSLSTLTVSDGYVYSATTNGDGTVGHLRRVSLADGSVSWDYAPEGAGYYWCGGIVLDQGYLVTRADGRVDLMSLSGEDGAGDVLASLDLGEPVRSTPVVSADKKSAYVVTRGGKLYKISIAEDGGLSVVGSVQFAGYSTSTPTLVNGKLVVGGATGAGLSGGIYVIDADSLEVVASATALKGGASIGEVKSAPLVVRQGDELYAYFTAEAKDGGLYVYRLGDDAITRLYLPQNGQNDYSMSSVVCAPNGSLYFTNDSGYLFKVASGSNVPPQFDFDDPDVAQTAQGVLKANAKTGELSLVSSTDSSTISTIKLSNSQVTGILVQPNDQSGSVAYLVTEDGTVYRVSISSDGQVRLEATRRFAQNGSGTPSLVDGRLYVKDGNGSWHALDPVTLASLDRNSSDQQTSGATGQSRQDRRSAGRTLRQRTNAAAGTTAGSTTTQASESTATEDGDVALALLGGESSTAIGRSNGSTDDVASTESATGSTVQTLPWWPIVGMIIGAVVLILALVRRRHNQNEEA